MGEPGETLREGDLFDYPLKRETVQCVSLYPTRLDDYTGVCSGESTRYSTDDVYGHPGRLRRLETRRED